ncbi:hypothetical protein ACHAXR_008119 [Thalassiosira sp. AJA248-18]
MSFPDMTYLSDVSPYLRDMSPYLPDMSPDPNDVSPVMSSVTNFNDAITSTPPKTDNEEIHDCISAMIKQDENYRCPNYLKGSEDMNEAMSLRSKTCKWILDTVHAAKYQRETAVIAISYLDRFICVRSSSRAREARHNRTQYQLVAMTCLYISIKITEAVGISASTFSRLSGGHNSEEDIVSCEKDILAALQWRVNGPSPFQFVSYILELLPDSAGMGAVLKLYGDSHRQIELAMGDYIFVPLCRSSIAVAAIVNSLESFPKDYIPREERAQFLQAISDVFDFDVVDSPLIKAVRMHLLERCVTKSSKSGLSPKQKQ